MSIYTQYKLEAIPRIARLELTWTHEGGDEWTCHYDLVLPLGEVDCRGLFNKRPAKKRPKSHRMVWLDADNCKRIPLGRTRSTRSQAPDSFKYDEFIDKPFRDGVHIQWDSEQLGLRKFVICGTNMQEIITNTNRHDPLPTL